MMRFSFALLAMVALGCGGVLAEQPEQPGEPAEFEKQPNAPGVVAVVTGDGATLFTNATSSDYPPVVVFVDDEAVNRF